MRLIGTARAEGGVVSFVMDGIHPHDIGTIVDREGVAIRTGHHCAQPVMDRFGIPATARASFAMYNTLEEIDALVAAVARARDAAGVATMGMFSFLKSKDDARSAPTPDDAPTRSSPRSRRWPAETTCRSACPRA